MQAARCPRPASTASLPTNNSGRGRATKRAGGYAHGSVEVGRPSTVHFFQPPFSTAASSKPTARSIHQTRAAHMFTARSYSTTRVPSPTPSRAITVAICSSVGIM